MSKVISRLRARDFGRLTLVVTCTACGGCESSRNSVLAPQGTELELAPIQAARVPNGIMRYLDFAGLVGFGSTGEIVNGKPVQERWYFYETRDDFCLINGPAWGGTCDNCTILSTSSLPARLSPGGQRFRVDVRFVRTNPNQPVGITPLITGNAAELGQILGPPRVFNGGPLQEWSMKNSIIGGLAIQWDVDRPDLIELADIRTQPHIIGRVSDTETGQATMSVRFGGGLSHHKCNATFDVQIDSRRRAREAASE